jgi:hypothetical protein
MKKYLFGLSAIALAVAFTAFTMPNKAKRSTTNEVFAFNYAAGSSLLKGDVETESYWVYDAAQSLTTGCTGNTNQACKIEVDPAFIDATVTPHVLNSSAIVIAKKGTSNLRYIPDLSAPTITVVASQDKQ